MPDNYRAIVADIKAHLDAPGTLGFIHDYERQARSASEFIGLFTDSTGRVWGWEITRRSASEHQRGAFFRHHRFMLKGYRGLQDALGSSIEMQEAADGICALFRTAEPLAAGATWQYRNGDDSSESPVQLESINDRMFGNVLCHCAEISLSITERILI